MGGHAAAARRKWDDRYGAADYIPATDPDPFLVEVSASLAAGRALCIAAGCGRNAVFLAERGFAVTAVDISQRGVALCEDLARDRGVEVEAVVADMNDYDMGRDAYDLITMLYYYDESLFPGIRSAVRPAGHFLIQTFSTDQLNRDWGPRNPDHLADGSNVLEAFGSWRIRHYEDSEVPESEQGEGKTAAIVRLLAEKGEAG